MLKYLENKISCLLFFVIVFYIKQWRLIILLVNKNVYVYAAVKSIGHVLC